MGAFLFGSGPPPEWQVAAISTTPLTGDETKARKLFTDNSISTGKVRFLPRDLHLLLPRLRPP
jgi:hypothetical protein